MYFSDEFTDFNKQYSQGRFTVNPHLLNTMKINHIAFLLVLLLNPAAYAQKIKYKDIFSLLEQKQYEAAEPLLKQYLEKDQNNPSAYLYMGIILMDKYYQTYDPKAAKPIKDGAVNFLRQAKLRLDEREVSKNEKYYASYRRRNVRSGDMEVRLSDIVYDIDNRISKLTEADKTNLDRN